MPNQAPRIGVPTIQLPLDSDVTVPALTTLTFSACGITATEKILNDVNSPLDSGDVYQVMLGLVGRDVVNGGYTVGRCSPSSGDLVITSGQVIEVKVANSDWPANFDKAVCVAVFLKINQADFQLAQFAYLDSVEDFSTVIKTKPLRVSPRFGTALLQSTTADVILGSRSPKGILFDNPFEPTTDEFTITDEVEVVTVSPNNGPDYDIPSARGTRVNFSTLVNNLKNYVLAAAGNYVEYSSGGKVHREAHQSLASAQALLKGNKPILITLPGDEFGAQDVILLIGNLTVNSQELASAWSKTAATPITVQLNAAATDRLITNQHTKITKYVR